MTHTQTHDNHEIRDKQLRDANINPRLKHVSMNVVVVGGEDNIVSYRARNGVGEQCCGVGSIVQQD